MTPLLAIFIAAGVLGIVLFIVLITNALNEISAIHRWMKEDREDAERETREKP